jgi:sensor histidine kinase regulating citrate/malate metabolism
MDNIRKRFFELEIQTNSKYTDNKKVKGKGTETINQRLTSLRGKMEVTHNDNSFQIFITVPLNAEIVDFGV